MKTRYKDVNNKESEGDTAAIEINAKCVPVIGANRRLALQKCSRLHVDAITS